MTTITPRAADVEPVAEGAVHEHDDTVTLYHFTNRDAWTSIVDDGEIRPSGESLDREGGGLWPPHHAPDIVWLTTDPNPGWCCEVSPSSGTERFAVRFTVRLPAIEVQDLWTWAIRHKVCPPHLDPTTIQPPYEARRFRCIERPVVAHTEWVAVDQMHADGLCSRAPAIARERARQAVRPRMTSDEALTAVAALGEMVFMLRREARGS